MRFINILVEGQTEETFINDVIAPHLQQYQLHITPIILMTKRTKSGQKYRGGDVKYPKVKKEVGLLLKDKNAVCVTTMIDFYGIRDTQDFPKYSQMPHGTAYERIAFLEKAIRDDINQKRFLPYFSLHELEALLFTAPHIIADYLDIPVNQVRNIRSGKTPEEINLDNPPSHRIYDLYPRYGKGNEFVQIVEKIPLQQIRAECRHFHEWLTQLELLGISP
ncbi:MAG: DUF4276 family protein [bacterium]|nr:DUF4276 family protein [bacterium]